MNAQQSVGLTRGLVTGIIAILCSAAAWFCAHAITSDPNVQLALTAAGMFLSAVATLLGFGTYDGNRARAVRMGKYDQLHPSDVGSEKIYTGLPRNRI